MGILITFGVVLILEADSFGERVDRVGLAGEEMPARSGIGAAVATDVVLLLSSGHLGSLARIETHGDQLEFVAYVELHQAHGAGESGQSLAAKHGAVVIYQVEDQGLAAVVIPQLHDFAGVLAEGELGRHLRVQVLLDADVL